MSSDVLSLPIDGKDWSKDQLLPFLIETKLCNFTHPEIISIAEAIREKAQASGRSIPVEAFYAVRDAVEYSVGVSANNAAETLISKKGSCSHKANLLVAVLRYHGIPAAYRYMRVFTREYLGPVNTKRFYQFMSSESVHFYAAMYCFNQNKWIDVDPSDDAEFSKNTQHINPPSKMIDFDGVNPAHLHINKAHIAHDNPSYISQIDEILAKPIRLDLKVLEVYNKYVEYMRNHGLKFDCANKMSDAFFVELERNEPDAFEYYCKAEIEIERRKREKFEKERVEADKKVVEETIRSGGSVNPQNVSHDRFKADDKRINEQAEKSESLLISNPVSRRSSI